MRLERIFTMANRTVRLQFIAMERSLRAVGCKLPLFVIPYDDQLFELPPNAYWYYDHNLFAWLASERCHPTMRKYVCLLSENYHFLDTDVILLEDPSTILQPFTGLVASCTEWAKPAWTYTASSALYLAARTSTWMRNVFSSGQFAIDRQLYSAESLRGVATSPEFVQACLRFPHHEQPGINQLVLATDIPRVNLTLPPHGMESTWAGDYPGEFRHLWSTPARQPYLIHWAGPYTLDDDRPIHQLFYDYLSTDELAEWQTLKQLRVAKRARDCRRASSPLRKIARVLRDIAAGGCTTIS